MSDRAVSDAAANDRARSDRYDYLFERTIEAAKPALAVVIVYAIAFYMGWEKPYWATVSVFSVNLMCRGMTLYRGFIRVMGTILGGTAGLVVIALFPQERFAYQIAAMIPVFLFAYGCTGKNEYFYVVAGITFCVVMGVTWQIPNWESGESHQIVMLRITQTWMGSLVMVLVSVYLWPKTSIAQFEDLARKIWVNHHGLFGTVRRAMSGADVTEEARRTRLKDVDLQEHVHFVLHLAENDSFEMLETGHDWHQFLHESGAQVECLESIREGLSDLKGLDLSKILPNLDAVHSELDQRYEQTVGMLDKKPPTVMPQTVALQVDEAELNALPAFQQAAVLSIQRRFGEFEAVSRALFDCVARIRMFEQSHAEDDAHETHDAHAGHAAHAAPGPWLAIDIERVWFALGIVATIWIGFFCWLFVYDVPISSIFWAMCGVLAFVITYRGEMRASTLLWSWGIGVTAAFICNVFIFQYLDGYREFAILVFTVTFLLGFIFYPMSHPGARMFTIIAFTIIVQADQHQHYSLKVELTYVLWIWMTLSIPIIGKAIFTPWRPEKMFLRLYDRFFRHAYLLLSAHGPQEQGFLRRNLMAFYQNDLADLPRKCALYASAYDSFKLTPGSKTIDYKTLGTTPDKVQELLISLYLLSYRVKDLIAARELPRMDAVEGELLEGKQEWLELTGEWFRLRATDPAKAMDLTGDLPARLAKLEPHIDEAFARVDQSALSIEDRENFYTLLTSYRRLSEAMVNHARVAAGFDWPRWRELRF